jgi:3-oxoacyl-[acyl-carrier protein] reductase
MLRVDLSGKVALVTGASRGIGECVSSRLAEAGAHVFITARGEAALLSHQSAIEKAGGRATAVAADVGSEEDVRRLFGRIGDEAGRLDVMVNNAAVGIWGPLKDFSIEDFDTLMRVNARGVYMCCQLGLHMMIPKKEGVIINIASVVGFKGYPNQSAYTASKHAVMGLTKSLAVEAQPHGVCVSAISPGGVDTELAAAGRPDLDRSILIRPDDIAATIFYLLSLSPSAWVDHIHVRRRTGTPF